MGSELTRRCRDFLYKGSVDGFEVSRRYGPGGSCMSLGSEVVDLFRGIPVGAGRDPIL